MNSNLIYDVGMHVGEDTDYYLRKGYRVVAIEANPILAHQQQVRFAQDIAQKRLVVLNVGIAAHAGELPFFVNDAISQWSSFNREIGTRGGTSHQIIVPTVPLRDIMAEHGTPYYLKVDIEGYDLHAIESLTSVDSRPKYISVENGQRPLIDTLVKLGYSRFKFVNQRDVPEQKPPFPSREGDYVDFCFPRGSSGLFGEEAPGTWLNFDDVWREIEAYWNNPRFDANIHGWFDLHAIHSTYV